MIEVVINSFGLLFLFGELINSLIAYKHFRNYARS